MTEQSGDLTGHKRPDHAWQESQYFRLLMENIVDYAILLLDTDGRVIGCNVGTEHVLGFLKEEIIGQDVSVIFTAEDVQLGVPQQELRRAISEGRSEDERWHIRKDGSRFWAAGIMTALREGDELWGFAKLLRDSTRRKLFESAMLESEQRYRTLAEAASDSIITVDQGSTILYVNPATERIFGYNPEELVGQHLTLLMPEYLRHLHEQGIRRYVETGHKHISWQGVELPGLHKSGREIPLEISFGEFVTGELHTFTGIARDITERKLLQRRVDTQHKVTRILAASAAIRSGVNEVLQAICEGLGWQIGLLWAVDRETNVIRAVEIWHTPSLEASRFVEASGQANFSPGIGLPGLVWASGEPAWIPDVTLSSNFPRARVAADDSLHTAFALPIRLGAETIGVMEFYDQQIRQPDQPLIDVMVSIGSQIGQFIERKRVEAEGARLLVREQAARREAQQAQSLSAESLKREQAARSRAEEAEKRSRFLAEVGSVLAASLDYEMTLSNLARLVVPQFADWCAIDMLDDQSIRRLAVMHEDAAKVDIMRELNRRYPPHSNDPEGVAKVIRSGEAEAYFEISDSLLMAVARDEEHLRVLRELGLKSAVITPLATRGKVIGAITWVMSESDRVYGPADLTFAEEVARRAAVAVDNARLYRDSERANRAKDEFLATVSHELRTPLNAILGWARMLAMGQLDEATIMRAIETIERNARSQAQLIEDLLDVSRIISGRLRLDVHAVELPFIIEAAIESVRPAADARNIRLQMVLDPNAGPVPGDQGRLQQVMWNLLSNAVKFSSRGGQVQVRLERVNSHVEITVSDNGQGITPEFLPHVFERFRQADGSHTRAQGGLGLGLAIVRHLVELHGGTVHAYSAGEGQGATFTVRLPLAVVRDVDRFPQEAGERRHPTAEYDAVVECVEMLDGLRVLIVDDEPDARELLATILGRCGAEVKALASVEEALDALQRTGADVLVSDIEMPGQDGYSLIRKIRGMEGDQGVRIPAAALTAHARVEDRLRALAAGYDSHLAKPVEPAELVTVIASLMRRAGRA